MISVIVPFQKGIHFLKDCLQSLSEQTYKDFEVILVYNGVTEDVNEVVAPFKEKMNIREFTEETIGVGNARNVGLSKAGGEYVYFIDADDYINVDVIENLVNAIQKDNLDFVYGTRLVTWLKKASYESLERDAKEKEAAEEKDFLDLPQNSEEEKRVYQLWQLINHFSYEDRTIAIISALHVLIRMDYIKQHNMVFCEEPMCADLLFIAKVLTKTEKYVFVPKTYYMKRRHNDPIHFPAILQDKKSYKYGQFFAGYEAAMKELDPEHPYVFALQMQMLRYMARTTMPMVVENKKEDIFRGEYLDTMMRIAQGFEERVVKNTVGYPKRLIKAMRAGNRKKTISIVKRHQIGQRIKLSFEKKNFFKNMIYKRFTKMSMKDNWVVFETFRGKSYSDSPKYIYEYLAKNYGDQYKFIWVINDFKGELPYGGKVINRTGLSYYYYIARAKYFVCNTRQPNWYIKRKKQIFLSTWHGTPLKRLVFDQDDVTAAAPLYKQHFFNHVKQWDYLVSPNDFSTKVFESAFMCPPEKIVPCGYPRNDILYTKNNPEDIAAIKKKLGIPEDKKIILYAPTWRDDQFLDHGQYLFTLELDLKLLRERLKDDYVLVLRTHYYIANNLDIRGVEDFVYNESEYDDISELYLISDILITDYSSVFFDYGNLKRPMLFFTYDLDKYRDILRGFYLDMHKDLPGPLLMTSEEVVDAIENMDALNEKYANTYKTFYDRFCHLDDGHASERIVELVFNGKQLS